MMQHLPGGQGPGLAICLVAREADALRSAMTPGHSIKASPIRPPGPCVQTSSSSSPPPIHTSSKAIQRLAGAGSIRSAGQAASEGKTLQM